MRSIHDLKNPVNAIYEVLNDNELSSEKAKEIAFVELEDLNDMLDNLKAEFKSHLLLDVNERNRDIVSLEFISGLKRTHLRQAKNRNTKLKFSYESDFPIKLWVQRLNIKKIINNLITNAIKHTKDGYVDVSIRLESINVNHFNTKFILVGAQPVDGNMYLTFEVKDNGSGIPSD